MPNFKAKKLKELILPYEKNGTKFVWKAQNENVILVFTQVGDESFFLEIKKGKKAFVIKADKHSKPSEIGKLQKALYCFKEGFCENEDILSEAFAFKNTALIENTPLIAKDFNEILAKIKGKIYIEIGFGSGRHLLFRARQNPEILILGVEIYNPALSQVAKLAKAQNLDNILLIQSDARLLLSVLPSKSVEKIFLHFPVPWDKKPHRRVVSLEFCKECARVLEEKGSFELRTDSFEYFDFTLKNFLSFNKPKLSIKKNENLEISSKYEDRWKKQEKDIYDLCVWNLVFEDKEEKKNEDFKLDELEFDETHLLKLKENFSNESIKKEDFFLHFENIYTKEKALILKIAFGAFNKPEHTYILLDKSLSFVFKEPFKIKENLKAIKEFKERLKAKLKA